MEVLRRVGLLRERRIDVRQALLASGAFFAVLIDDLIIGAPLPLDQANCRNLNATRAESSRRLRGSSRRGEGAVGARPKAVGWSWRRPGRAACGSVSALRDELASRELARPRDFRLLVPPRVLSGFRRGLRARPRGGRCRARVDASAVLASVPLGTDHPQPSCRLRGLMWRRQSRCKHWPPTRRRRVSTSAALTCRRLSSRVRCASSSCAAS